MEDQAKLAIQTVDGFLEDRIQSMNSAEFK